MFLSSVGVHFITSGRIILHMDAPSGLAQILFRQGPKHQGHSLCYIGANYSKECLRSNKGDDMGSRTTRSLSIICLLILLGTISSCGGAGSDVVHKPDAITGATDAPMEASTDAEPVAEPEPHLCARPIDGPSEVFPRIEAVRLLPEEDLTRTCGLAFVEMMSSWRSLPVDLLAPIVEGAGTDRESLSAWVTERVASAPKAAADVVAMDILSAWKVGDDPSAVEDRVEQWAPAAQAAPEIKAVVDAASGLAPMLARVNEIHRLRCTLEVNALGFAVKCKPIHPQGKNIELSWKTATRDGLIEDLQVAECKGKSCKKLKKSAAKLKGQYLALVADIEKVPVLVLQEQMKAWLILPPFKSNTP